MATKIAINGFGRIGRAAFKIALESKKLEVVALNDLTDNKTLAHLLKYDSVYGTYEKKVEFSADSLTVGGKKFMSFAEKEPAKLPWKDLGVDVILECTGFFTLREGAESHLKAGAKKVIISAPSKSPDVKTFVLGVNEKDYDPSKDDIISNASCTTNALAPAVKVLNDELGIVKALMTTIHSYTSTQRIVDGPHKDLRRARAAAINIIPTTTGASIATTKTIPELEKRLDGIAIRVPTAVVSVIDLVAHVTKPTSQEAVQQIYKKAADGSLKGILGVNQEPLVSTDFIKTPYSVVVDLPFIQVLGGNLVKVLAWYDNEWGYAERLVDMAEYVM